jgi:hypothetical protein
MWWPRSYLELRGGSRSRSRGDTWWPRSCTEPGGGATATRGAPRAALSREASAGAVGTRGAPRAAMPFILTWRLYAGVPDLQGTNSGPQAHLRRACEPTSGVNSSTPHLVILNFLLGSLKR